jgi:hypothetical protein
MACPLELIDSDYLSSWDGCKVPPSPIISQTLKLNNS